MTAAAPPDTESGLHVLNCGMGDVTVTFNDPAEVKKASEMIEKMLRQGFAVLLRMEDDNYQRITGIDVASGTVTTNEAAPAEPVVTGGDEPAPSERKRRGPKPGTRRPRALEKRTPLTPTARVYAVGRSAGG